MRIFWISILFCSFISKDSRAQKVLNLKSPNGDIGYSFKLNQGSAGYSVTFRKKLLVNYSPLSLVFDNGTFGNGLKMGKPIFREGSEDYELIVGKNRKIRSCYNELLIPLEEINSPIRRVNLNVRVFDDGLAFRYEFPISNTHDSLVLLDENSSFVLAGNPLVRTLFLPSFTTSHEGLYSILPWNEVKEDTLMDMPALFEFPDQKFLAITEAALLDYAGMYLVKHGGILLSKLSPLPDRAPVKVKEVLPHHSPWRVLMISDRVGALIESNILTNLNEPPKMKDWSWLKPGKTTFPWWNGNITPDTAFAPGNNFETNKYYIDFCARNGIEYHSVVEYGLHEWYRNDGANFMPGPHADPTKPVPGLNMQEICDYAKSKGVGIRVWVYWSALYAKLDAALEQFEKWGIAGMMVDFMDRDDQDMVNIQTEILEKSARHHIHIQFHGAYKPTGLSRTFPNELTREGTLNYESNKWNEEAIGADHDINMPFTRMLAGSTDYHLGGFRAVPRSKYKVQYTRPLMISTRCHMLAMYVVLENYLGMVCDYPAAYEGQPGFEFIREVPTVWDETRVIDARAGEYIVVARRKNNDWYIGCITNHEPRNLSIPMNFLGEGNYEADIFADAPDVQSEPNHLTKETRTVSGTDNIPIILSPGGGAAMRIRSR